MEQKEMHIVKANIFYSHCYWGGNKETHNAFLLATGPEQPLIFPLWLTVDFIKECFSSKIVPYEICSFCINVRFVLNFSCYKVCFPGVHEHLKDIIINFDD